MILTHHRLKIYNENLQRKRYVCLRCKHLKQKCNMSVFDNSLFVLIYNENWMSVLGLTHHKFLIELCVFWAAKHVYNGGSSPERLVSSWFWDSRKLPFFAYFGDKNINFVILKAGNIIFTVSEPPRYPYHFEHLGCQNRMRNEGIKTKNEF